MDAAFVHPPLLALRGSAHEIGATHGRLAADRVRRVVGLYPYVVGLDATGVARHGARIRRITRDFAPSIADEVDAIADASGVDPLGLWMVQGRSELMSAWTDGCTGVRAPGVLGQTWDWVDLFEPLTVVLDVIPDDGPRYVTLTEAGMPAKLGCNDAGLAVGLQFVTAPGPHDGVPIHVVLRRLLSCRSIDEALDVVASAGTGRAGRVLVAALDGAAAIEFLGRDVHVERFRADAAATAHCNHSERLDGSGADLTENSMARLDRVRALLDRAEGEGPVDHVGVVRAVLADRVGRHPVAAPYVPREGVHVGTCATVVSDLAARRFAVTLGPDGRDHEPLVVDLTEPWGSMAGVA
jgi:isopenicillin-N N-acyltransferase-like protein